MNGSVIGDRMSGHDEIIIGAPIHRFMMKRLIFCEMWSRTLILHLKMPYLRWKSQMSRVESAGIRFELKFVAFEL